MGPGSAVVIGLGLWLVSGGMTDVPGDPVRQVILAQGKHLFVKEWFPGDFSEHGGDGLGPVYNATSCVACHHQAGIGGAGPADKNVDLVTAVTPKDEYQAKIARGDLVKLHPDFARATSLTLHRYGTSDDFSAWRDLMLKNHVLPDDFPAQAKLRTARRQRDFSDILIGMPVHHGEATITRTQLNTPALFGAGLLDAIPSAAIEAVGKKAFPFPQFPEIKGRVNRLSDGRIGRFGWKSQAARLNDFVLTACAVELGLEVPGHPQSSSPVDRGFVSPGLDLAQAECNALTAFVRDLPRPAVQLPETSRDAEVVRHGAQVFQKVGCAACHTPSLGGVDGLFSDLLLHDMGFELSSAGVYDTSSLVNRGPTKIEGDPAKQPPQDREWRTPPLWGLRDSGPYLHDGRARDIERAVASHGGEAERTANRYFKLSLGDRLAVERLLKSLVAPRMSE